MLTKNTLEWRQWRCFAVFIFNFEHLSHLVLVFLLLTLNTYMPTGNIIRERFYQKLIFQNILCANIDVFLNNKEWLLKAKWKEMKKLKVLSKNDRENLWRRSTEMVYGVTTICSRKIYFSKNSWFPYTVFCL